MMINKRLIGAVPESKKYIAGNVALQWCSLCANIAMMSAVTALLAALYACSMTQRKIVTTAVIALAAVAVRYGCTVGASRMGYLLLEKQRDLAAAKAEAIESSAKMEDLYLKAAKAMKSYQGQEDEEDEY